MEILSRVSPLVKVVDHTQPEATTSDTVLHFLLNDALTGNSRTVLIYCIHLPGKSSSGPTHINLTTKLFRHCNDCLYPPGLLDDETPSALALAQKARRLVTKATAHRWCPRATEQDIRDNITELRTKMMSQGENEVHNTYRLAELTQNLLVLHAMTLTVFSHHLK